MTRRKTQSLKSITKHLSNDLEIILKEVIAVKKDIAQFEKLYAEKQYEARQKSAVAGVKGLFPDPDRSIVEVDTLVNYAALKGMPPVSRRINGFDDATYKELDKNALKIMAQMKGGAPAAGAANPAFKVVGVRE